MLLSWDRKPLSMSNQMKWFNLNNIPVVMVPTLRKNRLARHRGWWNEVSTPVGKPSHTCHHLAEMFFNLAKSGLKAMINDDYKVSMPFYDGILSTEEIIVFLSFIKSRWPEEVVEICDKINDNLNFKTGWTDNRVLKSNATQVHINAPTVVDQLVFYVNRWVNLETGIFCNILQFRKFSLCC